MGVLSCGSVVCDYRLLCVMVMGSLSEMLRMYVVGHNPCGDEKAPGRKVFFLFQDW